MPSRKRVKNGRPRPRKAQTTSLSPYLRPEVKYVDSSVSTSFDYNGIYTALSSTSLGDGVSGRTGRSLRPTLLDLSARYTVGATSPVTCRALVIRYLANGAAFSIADILSIVGSGYATQCPYNIDFYGQAEYDRRIEVLFDSTFTVATNFKPTHEIKRKFPMRGPRAMLRYNGSDPDPVFGGLFFINICTLAGPSGLPSVTGVARLHFLDA